MKKILIFPALVCLILSIAFLVPKFLEAREESKAMEQVIRLHVRAADDSEQEQALKLKVRDGILNATGDLLAGCSDKGEAKKIIEQNLYQLEEAGQTVLQEEGSGHTVSVSLEREFFEYREYDGFFLPEGEYDSLIVNVGPGEGKNWWCVIFPAACYMGAAEIETDAEQMPSCFRLATNRAEQVTVKFWFWEKIKEWFS